MSANDPIFVGGVPRSGTTLLRVILDTHPNISCGPELRVVPALANLWVAARTSGQPLLSQAYGVDEEQLRLIFADLIMAFLRPAWQASAKPRVAEKTPWNLTVFPHLRRLFPESPLIHVIRDGRDVVTSRLERDRAAAGSAPFDAVQVASVRAREWVQGMEIRKSILEDPELARRYHELRYEDLVRSPEEVLRGVFAFVGEPYDPAVLSFHRVPREVSGSEEWSAEAVRKPISEHSIGRWRERLEPAVRDVVMQIQSRTLRELGYPVE
ncbi:MAG: sulfotransferase [Steroidobacteraceae bacterium]|nr:sulfotransferase [Steroidobacteraceae bacterium]